MKKIMFIGGAPVSGKTTLSRDLAKQSGAVELSTDSIRSWMKQLVSADDYPGLFYADNMSAEEFYKKYDTPESVIEGEINEGIQVAKGVIGFLKSDIKWESLIIEGIAITPELIRKVMAMFPGQQVEGIVLADKDKARIYNRISSRGLWGPLDTYPSTLIPTEVEWVVLYNQWFIGQANKHGIKVKYN
jgi:2-phosphoglycerate kinase